MHTGFSISEVENLWPGTDSFGTDTFLLFLRLWDNVCQ